MKFIIIFSSDNIIAKKFNKTNNILNQRKILQFFLTSTTNSHTVYRQYFTTIWRLFTQFILILTLILILKIINTITIITNIRSSHGRVV